LSRDYFLHQLNLLKALAPEFALANPALAPFLNGPRTDPDVERTLEAVAFQNSLLCRNLDLDFPQMVVALAQLMLPHYLRPIPASTIVRFVPGVNQKDPVLVPAATELTSTPVDGTLCRFQTTADLEVHPLEICDASYLQRPGRSGELRLSLAVRGIPLSHWQPASLRFFLAGDYASATNLYLLLSRHLSRIVLSSGDAGTCAVLPASCLTPAGFAESEKLLPYPPHAFPGYRLLQEYFTLPEKFLFFDLRGWEHWRERGTGRHFSISFELENLPFVPQHIRCSDFALHAVPAVNLFPHYADPISIDHRTDSYRIRPAGADPGHYQVYSVDHVIGHTRATALERNYVPFDQFKGDDTEPVYHAQPASSLRQEGYDVLLSVAFPGQLPAPGSETLSITLTCSNGSLPDHLRLGDISLAQSFPDTGISAGNMTAVHPGAPPRCGPELHRLLTSHLRLNQLPLESAKNLQGLLELYLFPCGHSGSRNAANIMRISGIEDLQVCATAHRMSGTSVRGREIRMKLRQDHFAGPGDLFLFGSVLENFLGSYRSLQCETCLEFQDVLNGYSFHWPADSGRVSSRPIVRVSL
jgi:type VI secretion system protein ImpG